MLALRSRGRARGLGAIAIAIARDGCSRRWLRACARGLCARMIIMIMMMI
jgi:hypothetical protein